VGADINVHKNLVMRTLAMACLLLAWWGAATAASEVYPARPMRLIVGVPPGGTTDIVARLVAARLGDRFGRPVVVDNRSGASGILAIQLVVNSQPDGHTLLISGSSITAIGSLYAKVPFDVAKDLVPVAFVATSAFVLVAHPSLQVTTLRDFFAYVKARPEGIHFAASSPGTIQHLSGEMLKRMTGVNLNYVPYKGTGAVMPDLLAGRVPVAFENVVTMRPHVLGGALRGLGVTSTTRSAVLPDVPTIAESGVSGFQANGRFMIFAHSRTTPQIVERLNNEVWGFIKETEFRDRLIAQGAEPMNGKPAELKTAVAAEIAQWGKVIREAGLRIE
jgi:tripartite-type tricarboxylate transporter receptor subunit TctC